MDSRSIPEGIVRNHWVTGPDDTYSNVLDPIEFPLHALTIEYRKQIREHNNSRIGNHTEAWRAAMIQALKLGADPMAVDTMGRTPLGLLVADYIYEGNTREKLEAVLDVAERLMDAGANPLVEDGALVFSIPDHGRGYEIGYLMFKKLLEMEANGNGMRDEQGGTALHLMAAEIPHKLYQLLKPQNSVSALPTFPDTWWTQPDDAGQQVLHRLWGKEGRVRRAIDAKIYTNDIWEVWKLMTTLLEKGGNLLMMDINEVMPADGMLWVLDQDSIQASGDTRKLADEVRDQIKCIRENADLERNTQPAANKTRRPGRI